MACDGILSGITRGSWMGISTIRLKTSQSYTAVFLSVLAAGMAQRSSESENLFGPQVEYQYWVAPYFGEVPVQDGAKDVLHSIRVKLTYADVVEVARVSRGDEVSSASWRSHSCHKQDVLHLAECVCAIIPARYMDIVATTPSLRLASVLATFRHTHGATRSHHWKEPLTAASHYFVLRQIPCLV
jgi:hypothetical protein